MKIKIFSGLNAVSDLEDEINIWLDNNNSIVLKHVIQSESSDPTNSFAINISIFYEEAKTSQPNCY